MPGSRIAIIAGSGTLPILLADALLERDERPFLLGIRGEADGAIERYDHDYFAWTEIGHLFRLLRANAVGRVALAGGVSARPDLSISNLDFGTWLTLPRVLGALLAGDDALLTTCISIIERKGFEVVGAHEICPELLAVAGANGAIALPRAMQSGLKVGQAVLEALGPHDVGQGCIVAGRRAVAIEGAEGTDGLLQRTADMRRDGRISSKWPALLVKAMKAGQDVRVDMPSIGPQTIELAADAGLAAVAVEAGRTLILDKIATLAAADRAGIAVHGFSGPAT